MRAAHQAPGTTSLARTVAVAVLLFLPAPIVIVVLASFSANGYLTVPPQPVTLRWYAEFLSSASWLSVLGTSALLALLAAIGSTAAALLAALAVHRRGFRGQHLFESAMLAPLVFPHAAIGVIMIAMLNDFGWLGTFAGLLLSHLILTIPYAYRPIVNGLRAIDADTEEAAMSLGARPLAVFLRVTLPALRPGLVTALLFSGILSFDEVTVTLFLIGPDVMTAPIKVFTELLESASPVVTAVSAGLVLFTVLMVLAVERLVGLRVFVQRDA